MDSDNPNTTKGEIEKAKLELLRAEVRIKNTEASMAEYEAGKHLKRARGCPYCGKQIDINQLFNLGFSDGQDNS